ncbi:hypothetical protein [Luteolibacter sp. AS25]|uniref:hypothetical protein n=1 Tax=Luteolibacter sp. AS25 TaxID=3135776 RepID=UPI00398A67BC
MKSAAVIIYFLTAFAMARAGEFRHVGDYLLNAHYKLTGAEKVPTPIKTMIFHAYTDGITIRLFAEDQEDSYASYEIYRSDGIARQRSSSGALEVIPGIQASSCNGGILRHLRLSKESFTLTTFPGVSDQTIVSHAVAATPKEADTAKN